MPMEGKRIICCLDGTWVNSDKGFTQPTVQQPRATLAVPSNVTRVYRALRKRGWDEESQVMYYHPGVGSTGDISDMIAGGVFGIGVSEVCLTCLDKCVRRADWNRMSERCIASSLRIMSREMRLFWWDFRVALSLRAVLLYVPSCLELPSYLTL